MRAVLLLNASASIREWLLGYVTLNDEHRIIDDAMQWLGMRSNIKCSIETGSDCQRNMCILCAHFCKECYECSENVEFVCARCVSDNWDTCDVCGRYYCESCNDEHSYDCEMCEATYFYCDKCMTESVAEGKALMHVCECCGIDYCDNCAKEEMH